MANKILGQRTELGSPFLNAMWIAGFLAILQIVAISYAVYRRGPSNPQAETPSGGGAKQAKSEVVTTLETTAPVEVPVPKVSTVPAESTRVSQTPPPPSTLKQRKAPDLSKIDDSVGRIEDSLLRRLVESAVADRNRGNYQAALDALQDAGVNLPDHPRILSELAGTYGEMGKLAEAGQYWNQVLEMGPAIGGAYHELAKKILEGVNPELPEFEPGQVIICGEPRVEKIPRAEDGEWVKLTIPVFGNPDSKPEVGQLNIRVHFYDLVDGAFPRPTSAKTAYEFPSAPYDWNDDSVEEIEVIYHQPVFTLEQKQKLGERVYFGHVIELYYQNVLQDSVVSADQLRELHFSKPKPSEKPPEPPVIMGPDTSLFPINR